MEKQSLIALQKLLKCYRIVFWYDEKGAFREYESLNLDGVEKRD